RTDSERRSRPHPVSVATPGDLAAPPLANVVALDERGPSAVVRRDRDRRLADSPPSARRGRVAISRFLAEGIERNPHSAGADESRALRLKPGRTADRELVAGAAAAGAND